MYKRNCSSDFILYTNNYSKPLNMKSLIVIFGLSVYAICYADNNVYSGNPRGCRGPENKDLLTFEVLPGLGWDNLANEEKGFVVNLNYSQCKTTEDGNYLIPDSMYVFPIKSSRTSLFSKICYHWSDTSGSINAGGSFKGFGFKISGSMSAESQSLKRNQIENSYTPSFFLPYKTNTINVQYFDYLQQNPY